MCKRVDSGLWDYESFLRGLAQMARISEAEVKRRVESNVPNQALFLYIASTLKPTYKIGMLSNAGKNWLKDLFTPEQVALFDAIALSYETGIPKPDERAYTAAAGSLGVEVAECVLIDDLPRYVTGAVDAGMSALQYVSFSQTRHDLELLLQQRH